MAQMEKIPKLVECAGRKAPDAQVDYLCSSVKSVAALRVQEFKAKLE
jgi:hypothetical protein